MPSRATKSTHVGMAMYEAIVSRVCDVTPHLRRITLSSDGFRDFRDDGPDQRFKLLLPRPGQSRPDVPDSESGWYAAWQQMPSDTRPVIRTYTVRAARPGDGEIDVDVVVHGESGPGSRWALRARPGQRVAVYGAYAEYEVDGDAVQLIAGDHTALPAIAAIAERLRSDAVGTIVVEVPDAGDELPLAPPPGVDVRWVHSTSGAPGVALAEAVTRCTATTIPTYAWVAADRETVACVRRHLVRDRGLSPDQVMFMGYWRTDGAIDDH